MVDKNWALSRYSYGVGNVLLPVSYSADGDDDNRPDPILFLLLGLVLIAVVLFMEYLPVQEKPKEKTMAFSLVVEPKPSQTAEVEDAVGEAPVSAPVEPVKKPQEAVRTEVEKEKPVKPEPKVKKKETFVEQAEVVKQEKAEVTPPVIEKTHTAGAKPSAPKEAPPADPASGIVDMPPDDDSGPYTGQLVTEKNTEKVAHSGDREPSLIRSGNRNLPSEGPVTGSLAAGTSIKHYYTPSSEKSAISVRPDGMDGSEQTPDIRMNLPVPGKRKPSRTNYSAGSEQSNIRSGSLKTDGPINGIPDGGLALAGNGVRPARVDSTLGREEISGIGTAPAGPGDGGPDTGTLQHAATASNGKSGNPDVKVSAYAGSKASAEPSAIKKSAGKSGEISYKELAICEDASREGYLMNDIYRRLYSRPEINGFNTSAGKIVFADRQSRASMSVRFMPNGTKRFVTRCELLEFALNSLKQVIRDLK
ncbi:hypothetical protein [Maridesulfovibrio sp.]|uniref:hypothetical protein n=1 Tax=Maridesulfovibrio sp. TaxID=2795000 RepID=UPI002A18C215|nr:hypothetical protein [Maridesulfovibrio sp.]